MTQEEEERRKPIKRRDLTEGGPVLVHLMEVMKRDEEMQVSTDTGKGETGKEKEAGSGER